MRTESAVTSSRVAANARQGGFTLIELLVVFTLLALLLSIAVPRYLRTADSSRVKVRDQNIATLRDALDKFKADQGHYPTDLTELVSKQYLRRIPVDPVTGSVDWQVIEDPKGVNTGVYDVGPPLAGVEPANAATPAIADASQPSSAVSPVPTVVSPVIEPTVTSPP